MPTTAASLHGTTRGAYGSFAGKAAAPTTGPHNPGTITHPALIGCLNGRYTFVAKDAAAPTTTARGRSRTTRQYWWSREEMWRQVRQDDEELITFLMFLDRNDMLGD